MSCIDIICVHDPDNDTYKCSPFFIRFPQKAPETCIVRIYVHEENVPPPSHISGSEPAAATPVNSNGTTSTSSNNHVTTTIMPHPQNVLDHRSSSTYPASRSSSSGSHNTESVTGDTCLVLEKGHKYPYFIKAKECCLLSSSSSSLPSSSRRGSSQTDTPSTQSYTPYTPSSMSSLSSSDMTPVTPTSTRNNNHFHHHNNNNNNNNTSSSSSSHVQTPMTPSSSSSSSLSTCGSCSDLSESTVTRKRSKASRIISRLKRSSSKHKLVIDSNTSNMLNCDSFPDLTDPQQLQQQQQQKQRQLQHHQQQQQQQYNEFAAGDGIAQNYHGDANNNNHSSLPQQSPHTAMPLHHSASSSSLLRQQSSSSNSSSSSSSLSSSLPHSLSTNDLKTLASSSSRDSASESINRKKKWMDRWLDKINKEAHHEELLTPPSDFIKRMKLKNEVTKITFKANGVTIEGRIFLWSTHNHCVISDIDGTITRSDTKGHILTRLGADYCHRGIIAMFNQLSNKGYKILYLTARPITLFQRTRDYIGRIQEDSCKLPPGPVITAPNKTWNAFAREMIIRKPETFKIAILKTIRELFPMDCNPFVAGFGNRVTDDCSYMSVGIEPSRAFRINVKGEIICASNNRYNSMKHLECMLEKLGVFPQCRIARAVEIHHNIQETLQKPVELVVNMNWKQKGGIDIEQFVMEQYGATASTESGTNSDAS